MAGLAGRHSGVQRQTLMEGELSRRGDQPQQLQTKLLGLATWKIPPIASSQVVLGRAVFGVARARVAMMTDPTLERWISPAMTLLSRGTGCG